MFSQLAKRSPCVVVSGYLQYFSHSKYFIDFLEARSEPAEEIRNALKIEKNITMRLCFSCISYLCFGTEIAGEIKTEPCLIDLNQQQRAGSIYRLHRFCRARIT